MINLKLLTDFQLVTFVLGIAFSILSVAMVFYSLRRPDGYRNTFLKVLFMIVLPMITFTMWFACVFAAYGVLESNELYIILLSIACGMATGGIAILIAWLIHYLMTKPKHERKEKIIIEEEKESKPVEIRLIEAPKEERVIEQTFAQKVEVEAEKKEVKKPQPKTKSVAPKPTLKETKKVASPKTPATAKTTKTTTKTTTKSTKSAPKLSK